MRDPSAHGMAPTSRTTIQITPGVVSTHCPCMSCQADQRMHARATRMSSSEVVGAIIGVPAITVVVIIILTLTRTDSAGKDPSDEGHHRAVHEVCEEIGGHNG